MRHMLILIGGFLLAGPTLQAQNTATTDTVTWKSTLQEVEVVSRRIRHANEANAGARDVRIDPEILQANKTRSLAELLTDNSAVYIKSMGMGALSTASFRGASAEQTKVNWNGINITPPLSGSFDFSQIPVFFTDNVNLYYGSSYTQNGSGAIGGSVNLFTDPEWNQGVTGRAMTEYGSFNTYTVGGQVNVSHKRTAFKTRVYYQHSDNDYTYWNKILTNTPFKEKREDAAYSQMAVMQEAYFRLSPYARLSAIAWYQNNRRELPQALGVVNRSHEEQDEQNFRGYAGLDWARDVHSLHLKAAWLYYKQDYDLTYDGGLFDPKGNRNRSKSLQLVADYACTPTEKLILSTALNYTYDRIRTSSYIRVDSSKYILDDIVFDIPQAEPPFKHHRNVVSWQASALWSPLSMLDVNGQYMFEHNNGRNVSTWSAGAVTHLFDRSLQIKGSVAYNYRFPGMNDLYWRPGGNPDLKPENGYSYDASVTWRKALGNHWEATAEASGYLMYIDNWILWLPKDGNQWIWTPQNKRDVRSCGVELYGKVVFTLGDFRSTLSGNYSWSQSRSRRKDSADDGSYMKQIPYVPRFKWNIRWALDYKNAFLTWQTTYIARRYITTDESYSTDPYAVHNLLLGYRHTFRNGWKLTPQLRVDNVANTYYESTRYYPMPLRNTLFSLMLEF